MLRSPLVFILYLSLISPIVGQPIFNDVAHEKGIKATVMGDVHGSGVALEDFDNDGDLDLYLCTARGYSNTLYRNDGGQFIDVTESFGLRFTQRSRMALWVDYDADGLLDLLVGGDCDMDEADCPETQHLTLFRNVDDTFEDVTTQVGLAGFGPATKDQTLGGMAAGDVNNDGYIDLLVAVRDGRTLLFENQKGNGFLEKSELYGLTQQIYKYYQPLIADFDGDGWQDIYCNVDFGANIMYINQQDGTYADRSVQTRTSTSFNEMGIALGDYDNDQDFDLYVTNIENYLGADTYNKLFQNQLEEGFLRFAELPKSEGLGFAGWGWGTTFFDADNDGWLDLTATNGWYLPFEVIDQTKFWMNNQDGTFTDLSDATQLNDSLNSTALAAWDYDRDGDLDLVQTLKGFNLEEQPLLLLENDLENKHNYVSINPKMQGPNKYAIGSVVRVYTQNLVQSRIITSGISFYTQEPSESHFGLGSYQQIDSVEILWPTGDKSTKYNVQANAYYTFDESDIVLTPQNFVASAESDGVYLTWNDQEANETGFVLERAEDFEFSSYEVINIPPNQVSFFDATARPNEIYYYRLKARRGSQTSNYTRELEVYTVIVGAENSRQTNFELYPNPLSTDNPSLLIQHASSSKIKLYDLRGNEIDFVLEMQSQDNLLRLEGLSAGMYLIQIDSEVRKLLIVD